MREGTPEQQAAHDGLQVAKHAALYLLTLSPSVAKGHQEVVAAYSPQLAWTLQCSFYSGLAGFCTGGFLRARMRSHQFLAENAHRLPRTEKGWYVYHRHKQLEALRAALSWNGGVSAGLRFAAIAAAFTACEASLEATLFEGRESWAAAMGAGISSGALFAIASRLPLSYAKHALLFGSLAGLGIGFLEDTTAAVTGVSVKYPMRLRSGSLDLWIPFWDWEKPGWEGIGVFRPTRPGSDDVKRIVEKESRPE